MERLILYYICAINLITFLLYGIDKIKSRRGAWRIPEAKLLLLAAIGGSVGAIIGMHLFHHKTLHKKFTLGIPAILVGQLALLALLIYWNARYLGLI